MQYIYISRAAALTTLTFVASATSTGSTITVPAGGQAGDLAILFDAAWNSSPVPTEVTPTNYTQTTPSTSQDAGANDSRTVISYRKLGAGEAGTNITGMNATRNTKIMLVFRPDNPITTVTPGSWASTNTSVDQTLQTVAASGQPVPLVVLGMCWDGDSASAPAFSTASPAFDAEVTTTSASTGLRVGYKIYNSSPANHDVDMGDSGNANALASGYLRVA